MLNIFTEIADVSPFCADVTHLAKSWQDKILFSNKEVNFTDLKFNDLSHGIS